MPEYRPTIAPYYVPIGTLPAKVDLLAPFVIQVNSRHNGEWKKMLPLLFEALHGDRQLRVYLPRATGGPELFPTLREAIIAVVQGSNDLNELDAARFFRGALKLRTTMTARAGHGGRAVLILIADQNMRRVFPEFATQDIKNPRMNLDRALDAMPRVRVARRRFSRDDEVAHCVPADGTKVSMVTRVFRACSSPYTTLERAARVASGASWIGFTSLS